MFCPSQPVRESGNSPTRPGNSPARSGSSRSRSSGFWPGPGASGSSRTWCGAAGVNSAKPPILASGSTDVRSVRRGPELSGLSRSRPGSPRLAAMWPETRNSPAVLPSLALVGPGLCVCVSQSACMFARSSLVCLCPHWCGLLRLPSLPLPATFVGIRPGGMASPGGARALHGGCSFQVVYVFV